MKWTACIDVGTEGVHDDVKWSVVSKTTSKQIKEKNKTEQ